MHKDQVDINTLEFDLQIDPSPPAKIQHSEFNNDQKKNEKEEDEFEIEIHTTQALKREAVSDADDEFNYNAASQNGLINDKFHEDNAEQSNTLQPEQTDNQPSILKTPKAKRPGVNFSEEVILEDEEENNSEDDKAKDKQPNIDSHNILNIIGKEISELKKNDQTQIKLRADQTRVAHEDMMRAKLKESKLQNNAPVIRNNLKQKNELIKKQKSIESINAQRQNTINMKEIGTQLHVKSTPLISIPEILPIDSQIVSKIHKTQPVISEPQIYNEEKESIEDSKEILNPPSDNKALPDAEWDKLNEEFLKNAANPHNVTVNQPITFKEAVALLFQGGLENEKKLIVPTNEKNLNFFQRLFAKCKGIYVLPSRLREERDNYIALTKIHLDLSNELHSRIIRTSYNNLTDNSNYSWQKIGFQSNNPSTDDRGMGIFGILQLLYFSENKERARECCQHSNMQEFAFPLAITLINFSSHAINALREGKLTNICKQLNSVIDSVNLFYQGSFNYFFDQYQQSRWNIGDYGDKIQRIYKYCKSNVNKIIKYAL